MRFVFSKLLYVSTLRLGALSVGVAWGFPHRFGGWRSRRPWPHVGIRLSRVRITIGCSRDFIAAWSKRSPANVRSA